MSKKIRNSSTQAKDLWDFLLILFKAFGWNECVDEMLLYLKNEKDGL